MPYALKTNTQWSYVPSYVPGGGSIPSPGLYSWENLAELSDKAAQSPSDYMEWVGFIKTAYVDGYVVDIRLSHVQKDWGFVFEFLEGPLHRMDVEQYSTNGWPSCEMRSWLNETYILMLPQELQVLLNEVEITTNYINSYQQSNDKLWLPSGSQITREYASGNDMCGELFQYYRGRQGISECFVKNELTTSKNSVHRWWLRSVYGSSKYDYVDTTSGIAVKSEEPPLPMIAAPCFCITAA